MNEEQRMTIDLTTPISAYDAYEKLKEIHIKRSKSLEILLKSVNDSHPEAVNTFLKEINDQKNIIHSCHTVMGEFFDKFNTCMLSNEEGSYPNKIFGNGRNASTIVCGSYFYTDISGSMRKCRVSKKNAQHVYYYPLNQRSHVLFNDYGIIQKSMKPTDSVYVSSDDEMSSFDLSDVFDE